MPRYRVCRASHGSRFSKDDVKQYLFDHARMPAEKFERYMGDYTNLVPGRRRLYDLAQAGKAAPIFGESADPARLVPIVNDANHFMRLYDLAQAGKAAPIFGESADPARLVPIVNDANHFMIAVTGDPLRTNAYAFSHNGRLGFPTAKRIDLPRDWNAKLAAA